jgi:WhiB family transcriptional regulator, redox-sensing transcriptional regulator
MTVTTDRGYRSGTDNRAEWWSLGACLSADPDLFFPLSEAGPLGHQQISAAKAVCRDCAVRRQCLEYALAASPIHGVWGGTSEEERRMLTRRQPPNSPPRPDIHRPARKVTHARRAG